MLGNSGASAEDVVPQGGETRIDAPEGLVITNAFIADGHVSHPSAPDLSWWQESSASPAYVRVHGWCATSCRSVLGPLLPGSGVGWKEVVILRSPVGSATESDVRSNDPGDAVYVCEVAMATDPRSSRFSHRTTHAGAVPDAVWWPRNRSLVDQLPDLITLWPAAAGHVARILYSPPDWDDRPRKVDVGDRIMKTGCFPRDDTHLVTLTLANGDHRTVLVIDPETPLSDARALLDRGAVEA